MVEQHHYEEIILYAIYSRYNAGTNQFTGIYQTHTTCSSEFKVKFLAVQTQQCICVG